MHQVDLNTLRSDTASELSTLRSLQLDTYRDMEILKERIESLKTQVAAQNERIRDNDADIARFSIIAATLGTLITIVVGGVTIAGVYGAGDRADASVRNWIKEEGGKVLKEEGEKTIKELTGPDSDFRKQMQTVVNEAQKIARKSAANIEAEGRKLLLDATAKFANSTQAIKSSKNVTTKMEGEQKTNKQITSTDWMEKANYAYSTGNKEDAIKHWDEAITVSSNPQDVAHAMVGKGIALNGLHRYGDAHKVLDEVIRRFGNATETPVREWVAIALINKGNTLGELGRHKEEIKTYDEVVRLFGNTSETTIREQVALALSLKGITLARINRQEDAIAVLDEVIRRFDDGDYMGVGLALGAKGHILSSIGRYEEAIKAYDDVIRRFGDESDINARFAVAVSLINKGWALKHLSQAEYAIRTFDEVIDRFGDATEAALREQVARALANKGFTLRARERPDDAIRAYDEVIRRFGETSEPALRKQVASALLRVRPETS